MGKEVGTIFIKSKVGRNANLYLNIIKGIAILLVLLGHSIQYGSIFAFDFFNNIVFKSIYSFHMPLFMLVSGYLFHYSLQKRTFLKTLANKTKTIGIPILIWNTLYYIISFVTSMNYGKQNSLSLILWFKSLSGLWFLWSVLAASIVVALICKLINKKFHIPMLVLGIFLVLIFPNRQMNVFMYPYFVVGYLFNVYKREIPLNFIKLKYICIPLFPLMLRFYDKKHFIYTSGLNPFKSEYGFASQIEIDIYRWTIGFVGSLFILVLVDLLMTNLKKGEVLNPIAKLGAVSLQIYVMQRIALEYIGANYYAKFVSYIGYNILAYNMFLYNYVFTPLIALGFAFILFGLANYINKNTSLRFGLFGR